LFVVHGGGDHLIGFERVASGHYALTFGRFALGAPSFDQDSGCATQPIHADAVRIPKAYLLALSSSRPLGTCQDDLGADGPPTRLEVARLDDGAASPVLVHWSDDGVPIAGLRLIRRPGGAWLVWQLGGSLHALGIDEAGEPLTPRSVLVADGFGVDGFAAADLGDQLAVAYTDAFDPFVSKIVLRVFDEHGAPVGESVIEPELEHWPVPPYALLGSPSGDRLLLAWTAAPGGPEKRVKVGRWSCADGG
jgi:hypothetical protein